MLSKMIKMLIYFLFAVLLQVGSTIITFADNSQFGYSCALPTMPGDSSYLARTAHGYLMNNISMPCTSMAPCAANQTSTTASPCCSSSDQSCQDTGTTNLKVCIRKTLSSNDTSCTIVPLTAGLSFSVDPTNVLGSFQNISSSSNSNNINVSVKLLNGRVCLTMPTPFGDTPLVCKAAPGDASGAAERDAVDCTALAPACFGNSNHSQSIFNFSGQAFECLIGSLDNIFFQKNSCGVASNQADTNLLVSFPSFQNTLRMAIGAAMVIYVIFFGIRLSLGEEKMSLGNLSMVAIKLILVTYFSVGMNLQYVGGQIQSTSNGITDQALPLLKEAMVDFTEIVFNAGEVNGLCAFDITKYQKGYEYYSLFDTIDCRIAYYLGMQMMSSSQGTLSSPAASGNEWSWQIKSGSGPSSIGLNNSQFFGFFWMLFGLLLGGNIIVLIFSLVFLIVFLGIVLHFISSFMVSMITLYVMIYISPIFVTFVLFNRTKGYFESWLKIVVSCALQPAILAGFIALVILMFDQGMYDTCQFNRYTSNNGTNNISTFVLVVPNGSDANACTSSVGYKMMRYFQGDGWDSFGLLLITINFINAFGNQIMSLGDITSLGVLCIIFYFFSSSMSNFASELTGGPNMKGVTVSADGVLGKIIDKAKEGASKAAAAASSLTSSRAADKAGGGASKAGDKGGGGSKAEDKGGTKDSAGG